MSKGFQISFLAFSSLAACLHASAQETTPPSGDATLHIVALIPTADTPALDPKFYRVDLRTGHLHLAYTLSLGYGGLDFMQADYASQRLVLAWPSDNPKNLAIFRMDALDSPTILPITFGGIPTSAWKPLPADYFQYDAELAKPSEKVVVIPSPMLLGQEGGGLYWLAFRMMSFRGQLIGGYRLDDKPKLEILEPAALAGLRIQGDFGLVNTLGATDVPEAHVVDGKVIVAGTDIGLPSPITTPPDIHWRVVGHDGNKTAMYVPVTRTQPISRGPFLESKTASKQELTQSERPTSGARAENCACTLYMRNGRSEAWKSVNVPGRQPRIKLVDSWLMGAAVCESFGRESPGADERRRYEQGYPTNPRRAGRPSLGSQYDYYPGILFLIDIATGHSVEIRTGQGDSEILLVHNRDVYYRVNDTILSAPIEGGSIGAPRLVVRGDSIPDVHWAFWGRSTDPDKR